MHGTTKLLTMIMVLTTARLAMMAIMEMMKKSVISLRLFGRSLQELVVDGLASSIRSSSMMAFLLCAATSLDRHQTERTMSSALLLVHM